MVKAFDRIRNVAHNISFKDLMNLVFSSSLNVSYFELKIYGNLSPWQRVQLSRHPSRPYTLDYINALTDGNFLEFLYWPNNKGEKNV